MVQETPFSGMRPALFFRLASNVFPDLGLVGRIKNKKKNVKKRRKSPEDLE